MMSREDVSAEFVADDDATSAEWTFLDGKPPWKHARRREVRSVRLPSYGAVSPHACAGCCAEPTQSLRERGPGGATLIVPYCNECHRDAAAVVTARISVVAASALLGITAAGILPLVLPTLGAVVHAGLSGTLAFFPMAFAVWHGRARRGGSRWFWGEKAGWWGPRGFFLCANAEWAQRLAAANGSAAARVVSSSGGRSRWLLFGPAVSVVLALVTYPAYRAPVRILNLTDSPLMITVDGRAAVEVAPSSNESARAGSLVEWPTGRQEVLAISEDGREIARRSVHIRAGREHLFAPKANGTCFWTETSGYGRAGHASRLVAPLSSGTDFWVLPRIDTWFAPNPTQVEDARSTGGVLVALRQALCEEAPDQAQAPDTFSTGQ